MDTAEMMDTKHQEALHMVHHKTKLKEGLYKAKGDPKQQPSNEVNQLLLTMLHIHCYKGVDLRANWWGLSFETQETCPTSHTCPYVHVLLLLMLTLDKKWHILP